MNNRKRQYVKIKNKSRKAKQFQISRHATTKLARLIMAEQCKRAMPKVLGFITGISKAFMIFAIAPEYLKRMTAMQLAQPAAAVQPNEMRYQEDLKKIRQELNSD